MVGRVLVATLRDSSSDSVDVQHNTNKPILSCDQATTGLQSSVTDITPCSLLTCDIVVKYVKYVKYIAVRN